MDYLRASYSRSVFMGKALKPRLGLTHPIHGKQRGSFPSIQLLPCLLKYNAHREILPGLPGELQRRSLFNQRSREALNGYGLPCFFRCFSWS